MRICEACGMQVEKQVCKHCGSAFYESDRAIVRITPLNYRPDRLHERSQKYMAPFISGTIQRMIGGK